MIKYKFIIYDVELGPDTAGVITDGVCTGATDLAELAVAAANMLAATVQIANETELTGDPAHAE